MDHIPDNVGTSTDRRPDLRGLRHNPTANPNNHEVPTEDPT